MNRRVEIHDSHLVSVIRESGFVVLRFDPAYVHESEGSPGVDPGTGWIQTVEVRVVNGALQAPVRDVPSDAWDGWVMTGQVRHSNGFPLPFEFQGPVELWLELRSGAEVIVRGDGIVASALGDPEYVEVFS